MAVHPRKTIRNKIITLLKAGVTSASNRVYDFRTQPAQTAPFINVTTPSDEPDLEDFVGLSTPNYMRILTVEIHCVETERPSSGTLSGDADDFAREVEEALADNITLDGLALSCLLSTTTLEAGDEVDPPAFSVILTYEVKYSDTLGN